jgi:hypothetical protein
MQVQFGAEVTSTLFRTVGNAIEKFLLKVPLIIILRERERERSSMSTVVLLIVVVSCGSRSSSGRELAVRRSVDGLGSTGVCGRSRWW